jgi:tetratricopeptide (TPR) repeat protein
MRDDVSTLRLRLGCALGLIALVAASCRASPPSPTDVPSVPSPAVATSEDATLAPLRALLEEARQARAEKDLALARTRIAAAVDRALVDLRDREDPSALDLFQQFARFADEVGDLRSERAALERVVDIRTRTLEDDHPDVQTAREDLAVAKAKLGDLDGARELLEKVVEVEARTLPADHPDLQSARMSLAGTVLQLGDFARARTLYEEVLDVRSRTLSPDDPDLQATKLNLATALSQLGDVDRARPLFEGVVEVFTRTLHEDDPRLQLARMNTAVLEYRIGDLQGARALFEKVVEVFSRTLPDDHPDLQRARGNLAATIKQLGDFDGARALEEKVLEIRSRALPDDHPDLQRARSNLASTLRQVGDVEGARALLEKVVEVRSRTLPPDHIDLQRARGNLGAALLDVGEFAAARILFEQALEIMSRTLSDEEPEIQTARLNLAMTLDRLGDRAVARALEERVLEIRTRTRPDDDPELQKTRIWRAWNLAEENSAGGSDGERADARKRCADLILDECRAGTAAARLALLQSSAREAESRCATLSFDVDASLTFANGYGSLEPMRELDRASLCLSETTRAAALSSAALMRAGARAPGYEAARDTLRRRSEELTDLVRKGATSQEFREAVGARDAAQLELVRLAHGFASEVPGGLDFDVEKLRAKLQANDAVVAYRRYRRRVPQTEAPDSTALETWVDSLCAFVIRSADARVPLEVVDLGRIAPIEDAVRDWRASLGVGAGDRGVSNPRPSRAPIGREEAGRRLRRLAFDPLRGALDGADHVICALDDVLHLVPLDALPEEEGSAGAARVLGDGLRIETRVTLTELSVLPRSVGTSGELVVLGGVAYGEKDARRDERAGILRGGGWAPGFPELPGTLVEARSIAGEFADGLGKGAAVTLLESDRATRSSLFDAAPRARWLHIATHGWFAADSIRSWQDPEPLDRRTGLALRSSGEEQVKGSSPMLLCGLALAGANLPEDALGRIPGLVTAEEIAALDLTSCDLAVLSACDTNVGERRAGQGVASLQKALQMAGARSAITSLWRVPDEATRELMVDFYRRLWIERKPKWQALWGAKKLLREAKDGSGTSRYAPSDWAAWVLTGDPN